jgi:hypothetical protein
LRRSAETPEEPPRDIVIDLIDDEALGRHRGEPFAETHELGRSLYIRIDDASVQVEPVEDCVSHG